MASKLTFASPVSWSSSKSYEVNTVVFHDGKAYTALQNVPRNTAITNSAYWSETGVPPKISFPSVSGWYYGINLAGWGIAVLVPSANEPTSVSVSGTTRIYSSSGGWQGIAFNGSDWSYVGGNVLLLFAAPSPNNLQDGCCYLVDASISIS